MGTVTNFTAELSVAVAQEKEEVANSSVTISAIVDILTNIANISTDVDETVMEVR